MQRYGQKTLNSNFVFNFFFIIFVKNKFQLLMKDKLLILVKELLENGIQISGVSILETGELAFEVNHFYKSGYVRIYCDSNSIYALARYNEVTELSETNPFASLVSLNYDWWLKSMDRYEGWKTPHPTWLKHFIKNGLVTENTVTNYHPIK